jgi:hypothetical protein
MPGFVVDSIPSSLVRAFSENWHRREFLAGNLRLKHISEFRRSADAREDVTEGHSHIRVPGQVPVAHISLPNLAIARVDHVEGFFNRQSEFLNPTYILCASGPSVDRKRLASAFGQYLVEISAPEAFLKRLFDDAVAGGIADREVAFLDAFPVQYSKGDVHDEPVDISDSLRLDYGQKPATHEWESEYRIALAFSGPLNWYPPYVELKLGSLSDIAQAV